MKTTQPPSFLDNNSLGREVWYQAYTQALMDMATYIHDASWPESKVVFDEIMGILNRQPRITLGSATKRCDPCSGRGYVQAWTSRIFCSKSVPCTRCRGKGYVTVGHL